MTSEESYKKAIKNLSKEIQSSNIDEIVRINLVLPSELGKMIQEFVLKIHVNDETFTYKRRLKYIKDINKKIGLEEILYTYLKFTDKYIDTITVVDTALPEHIKIEEIAINTYDKIEKDKSNENIAIIKLIVNICYLIIIINNDLLNFKIDSFVDTDKGLIIRKNTGKERLSIAPGLRELPFLITEKETEQAVQLSKFNAETLQYMIDGKHMRDNTDLIAKFIYKDNYKLYFTEDFEFTIDKFFCPTKLLRSRKFLIPKNGVVIKVLEKDNEIESIYLNEHNYRDLTYILGCVRYRNGSEANISFSLHTGYITGISCRLANKVTDIILDFYRVDVGCKVKYEVISPEYWKYRFNNYETDKEKELRLEGKKVKREFTVNIATFLRKINTEPSNKAITLAKKLCIDLEPGYTLVEEHTRTYNTN